MGRSERWQAIATVAAGGLVGSAARAGIVIAIPMADRGFPTAVLLVNLAGSFLLGVFIARRERAVTSPISTRFWAIGVLGSFTTFSTFSVDLVELLDAGLGAVAGLYVVASVGGGLGLALIGQRLGATR